jgi:hypothetical protein
MKTSRPWVTSAFSSRFTNLGTSDKRCKTRFLLTSPILDRASAYPRQSQPLCPRPKQPRRRPLLTDPPSLAPHWVLLRMNPPSSAPQVLYLDPSSDTTTRRHPTCVLPPDRSNPTVIGGRSDDGQSRERNATGAGGRMWGWTWFHLQSDGRMKPAREGSEVWQTNKNFSFFTPTT